MSKSFYKILFIFICALATIYSVGRVFDKGYKLFYQPFYEKLDEIFIGNTNYNLLLLGNSKVQFGMHPGVIDSVAKVNSYNLGYAASGFATMHLLLKSYLVNHTPPKKLVWCVQESMFFNSNDLSNKLLFYNYLPNQLVKNLMDSFKQPYQLPLFFSPAKYLYFDDYNKSNIAAGYLHKSQFTNSDMYSYKGYTISKNANHGVQFNPPPSFDADTIQHQSLFYFNSILDICRQHKISILFIWPPNANDKSKQKTIIGNQKLMIWMDSICVKNNAKLIRFDNGNVFSQTEFIDDGHLNYKGSLHFSNVIGKILDSLQAENAQVK
jgi:hypothetical protein